MRQDKERSIREQADLWKGYWCILACILLVGRVSYLTFFQNHIVSVYAAAQTEQKEDSSVQILQENLMEEIQIDDVQKMLDEIMDDHVFSVREALMNIINGEDPVSKETVRSFLYSFFFSDIENEKGLILKLLLVIFIAAVLAEFADVFGNGQAGSISFYIVYLALFTMLMENFSRLGSTLTNWLLGLTDFMKVLSPAYFMTVAASSGALSAAVFYEGVLLLVWLIQWILLNVLLPAAEIYVLLRLVNHLSREEMLGKFAEFLKTVVSWALKTLLGLVAGLQVVRGLVAPVMDSLKRSVIGKAAGALPGVGNAVNMVTELVITSAVLVRNCLGVLILLATVAAGAGPVIHYGMLSLTYRFLAAVSQPVSDKRMVECLSTMGEGFEILLKILFTAEVLCILTFLIIMAGIQGGGV